MQTAVKQRCKDKRGAASSLESMSHTQEIVSSREREGHWGLFLMKILFGLEKKTL